MKAAINSMAEPDAETVYVVKGARCPCACDGNGVLVYLACPLCRGLVLACDEIGNAFDNLEDLLASHPLTLWVESQDVCPTCGRAALASFEVAREHDLLAAGVDVGQCDVAGRDLVDTIYGHMADDAVSIDWDQMFRRPIRILLITWIGVLISLVAWLTVGYFTVEPELKLAWSRLGIKIHSWIALGLLFVCLTVLFLAYLLVGFQDRSRGELKP